MEKTKMTRVEMFKAIKERVLDNEDMVAFLDHQIELIENKSSKKSLTPNQKGNEEIKNIILEVLPTTGITVTDLMALDTRLQTYVDYSDDNKVKPMNNQKLTAILRLLYLDKKIDKRVEGKKTLYFLV